MLKIPTLSKLGWGLQMLDGENLMFQKIWIDLDRWLSSIFNTFSFTWTVQLEAVQKAPAPRESGQWIPIALHWVSVKAVPLGRQKQRALTDRMVTHETGSPKL